MRFSRRKVRADAGIRKIRRWTIGKGTADCDRIPATVSGMRVFTRRFQRLRSCESGHAQLVGPYDREDKVRELPAVAPAAAEVLRLKTEYKSIRCRLRRVPRQCAATVQRNHFDEATDRKDRSRNR